MPKRSETKKIIHANTGGTAEKPAKAKGLTPGLLGFAKISAVEGIKLRPSTKKMFADFDRRGLSPAERRREIFDKHAKKVDASMYDAVSDAYCYPGTTVLANCAGLCSQEDLDFFEEEATVQRFAEPLPVSFGGSEEPLARTIRGLIG